jgi:hypothetical protein
MPASRVDRARLRLDCDDRGIGRQARGPHRRRAPLALGDDARVLQPLDFRRFCRPRSRGLPGDSGPQPRLPLVEQRLFSEDLALEGPDPAQELEQHGWEAWS